MTSPHDSSARKVMFLTGTRADFGKLKPLMVRLRDDPHFDVRVFVTGMHMLSRYGATVEEVDRAGFRHLFKFINQNSTDSMDHVLAKTVAGLSDYVKEMRPDLIVVHGDRVESLAGASVGALSNVLVAHVEGGEVSGTVDELIRHAVSKLSHFHFVANEEARSRLLQLGEADHSIYVIGSPDIDVMNSAELPSLPEVLAHYDIPFEKHAVLLFHPVTSELADIRRQARVLVDAVKESPTPFVVIYPNNDHGSDLILEEYTALRSLPHVRIFPSMRFEYFLTLLRHARFMLGNSSAGVREAPHYGVPTVNVGTRQYRRVDCPTVLNVPAQPEAVLGAIRETESVARQGRSLFGDGGSADRFADVLRSASFWRTPPQKFFVDRALA